MTFNHGVAGSSPAALTNCRCSGDGINVRSCDGAARKDGGLCRNGFCGLKDMMTNAPINVAMPVAIRAKKNLVIYSGGLNPLFSQALMSDLIGCSANTF